MPCLVISPTKVIRPIWLNTFRVPPDHCSANKAPAIDKAQPPMQLATLSMLAAQKLQPGPLADAINFRDLAPTIAAVKQAYSRSPEAQQMITLINALK